LFAHAWLKRKIWGKNAAPESDTRITKSSRRQGEMAYPYDLSISLNKLIIEKEVEI